MPKSPRILLVAPQPFFKERGTPIAVKLLIETLCETGYAVDLLTYHEGIEIPIQGLRTFRIKPPALVSDVPIGLSWKKIVCDFFLSVKMANLLSRDDYSVVHAVEEAIFPALLFKHRFGYRLVYDMDSSMVEQILGQYPLSRIFEKPMNFCEKLAVRRADLVLPVSTGLSLRVADYAPGKRQCVLHDVPFVSDTNGDRMPEPLRKQLGISGQLAVYVGNLESYQGIDLLLQALSFIPAGTDLHLVVIGGDKAMVRHYRSAAVKMKSDIPMHFIGPRPTKFLSAYLEQADILISPRLWGLNTPMKVYSYMASGKPILATDIPAHNQVLDTSCALLVEPEPKAMAAGLMQLVRNPSHGRRIGKTAQTVVAKHYSAQAYKKKLITAYTSLASST